MEQPTPSQSEPLRKDWPILKQPPKTKRYYKPELDALRFVAFCFVFLHHAIYVQFIPWLTHRGVLISEMVRDFQNACALGVCLFFTLSAYLITSLISKEREQTGSFDLPSFYVRRILRIWPLYFFILVVALLIGVIWPSEYLSLNHLAWCLLVVGNFYVVFHGPMPLTIVHLWSISVEEQFYLFWPGVAKLVNTRKLAFAATALMLAAIYLIRSLSRSESIEQIWFNSAPHILFFSAGSLAAIMLSRRDFAKSSLKSLCFFAVGFALWLLAECTTKMLDFDFVHSEALVAGYLLATIGCVSMLLAALHAPPRFAPRWAAELGKISYGLYVYHAFVFRALRNSSWNIRHKGVVVAIVALPITIALAWLSYRFLEAPFLKLKQRFERVATRPV